jgi:periplasmic protein TonB
MYNTQLATPGSPLQIMDLNLPLHLITKHIAMTNKEIAQAHLLDIIFDNRNKEYGAYTLRQGYNNRMLLALGTGISVVLLFVFINNMKTTAEGPALPEEKKGIVLKQYIIPADKPKQPESPKELPKAKPKTNVTVTPKAATIQFTSPPKIKDVIKSPMPPVDDLAGKTIGDKKTPGIPDDGRPKIPAQPNVQTGSDTPAAPVVLEKEFIVREKEPEFPGGAEALKKFLARYLSTPGDLQPGDKKLVKVRFKVDKDGAVNTFEILTSGGREFDNEVVRVCKKMPKWIPAIQNGTNVPVSYVLPVTFIGLEE